MRHENAHSRNSDASDCDYSEISQTAPVGPETDFSADSGGFSYLSYDRWTTRSTKCQEV